MLHQDRGRVGADGVEGAVAERELAVEAGEEVQAADGDRVDQHQRQLENEEALGDERDGNREQYPDKQDRAAERQRRAGAGDRERLGGFHDHTRCTLTRPKRPPGFTTSTVTMMTSAIGSFSSLPT